MKSFESLIPHDAIILDIIIDRSNPGTNDSIRMKMILNGGVRKTLRFKEIYHAEFQLNFGIIAHESVHSVWMESKNDKIAEIIQKWRVIGGNLQGLKCFVTNTNSTNSLISIYAKNFKRKEYCTRIKWQPCAGRIALSKWHKSS